tara:strand:+ start:91829 stop:93343 length:1515 start_codon:yes stop_codon:yes gene_type:complete
MLNFPVPYQGELVYSLVARAGVHMGVTSPKQLLDEVFSDRKVVATVDLPCHLKEISSHYPSSLGLTVNRLAYEHTLFPIYASFVGEDRRKRCLHWMAGTSLGAIHLALGVSASRIMQDRSLRYCPKCMENQQAQYGEYYWDRKWQVSGSDCCLEHGGLVDALIERHGYHKHGFYALTSKYTQPIAQSSLIEEDQRVTRQVNNLLITAAAKSPTFDQWSVFYRNMAGDLNCTRGENIQFDAIKEMFSSHWSAEWLNKHELMLNDKQTCWLRSIFRKHRNSFSYLEHIAVLDAFLPEGWDITDVLKKVLSLPKTHLKGKGLSSNDTNLNDVSQEKRDLWGKYLKKFGVKQGRCCGGGGLYAWLYRHDRDWLLWVNSHYKKHVEVKNIRVDWGKRDLDLVNELIVIKQIVSQRSEAPRASKNWYLSQIRKTSTVAKNMDKLPLVRLFIATNVEDIATYQIRRALRAIDDLKKSGIAVRRWRVLRLAGLSEERLTGKAALFLKKAIKD